MSNDLNLGDLGITINLSEGEPASAKFTLPDGSVVMRPFTDGELNMRLGLGLGLGYQAAGGGGDPTPDTGPTPAYRHHNFVAAAVSAKTLDIAYPTGMAANDIMALGVIYDPVGGTGVSLNIPAGFTRIGTEQTLPNGAKTGVFLGRATGAEAGNLTVTLNGTLGASRIFTAVLAAYSGGLEAGDPLDHHSQTFANTNPGPVTMLPITTTGANRRCICFFFGNGSLSGRQATGGGPASGWLQRGSHTSATGFDSNICFDDAAQVGAGSPTNDIYDQAGSSDIGVHAFALKPNPA